MELLSNRARSDVLPASVVYEVDAGPDRIDAMRYIVIGAGAIGGTIGGRLAAGGHEVVLVARGAHLDALRAKGLTLATPDGTSTLDIPAVAGPGELGLREDDVLLLATKTQDAEPLLAELGLAAGAKRHRGRGRAAGGVCAERGGQRADRAAPLPSGARNVRVAAGHAPGAGRGRGERRPAGGLLHIGRYPSGADATAERIGADLTASGFLAPVTADVMRWKYGKLLANLSNATEAVCGHDAWLHATELRRRVTAEGRAVLDAAGIAYARERESAELRADRVQILPVNGAERVGGSSWQSLTRGTGSIEADFLNGEIVLLGREHGVPTPLNEVLQRLANQAARDRRAPGSATPDEVLALAALPADAG